MAADDLDGQLGLDLGVQPDGTAWVPTDLMGSASCDLATVETAPVCASTASARSVVVTEPKRRPSAPARAVIVTVAGPEHLGHGLCGLLVLGVAQRTRLSHGGRLCFDTSGGDEGAARREQVVAGETPRHLDDVALLPYTGDVTAQQDPHHRPSPVTPTISLGGRVGRGSNTSSRAVLMAAAISLW